MKKLTLIMLAILLCACGKEEIAENNAIDIKKEVTEEKTDQTASHIEKDKQETVYATADAYGKITKTEVEVILKASDGNQIEDVSNLTDIRNTHSDEMFTYEDGSLIFENKGEDIHYKGFSDEPLPVDVKVTYYLDGEVISAEDLAGKSGRVRIRFDYTNTTDATADGIHVIQPFIAVSLVILDPDKFANIETENGRLAEIGDSKAVLIMCAPGLGSALQLSGYELTKDIKLDDYGYIEADVRNFSLDCTTTILSNGLFKDFEDKDLNDLLDFAEETADFRSDANDLTESTRKLYNAAVELRNGMKEALDELGSSAAQLADGSRQLNEAIISFSELPQIKEILENLNAVKTYINSVIDVVTDEETKTALNDLITRIETNPQEAYNYLMRIFTLNDPDEISRVMETDKCAAYLLNPENVSEQGIPFAKTVQEYLSLIIFRQSLEGIKEGSSALSTGVEQFSSAVGDNSKAGNLLDELVNAAKEFNDGMNEFVNSDLEDFMKLGGTSLKNVVNRARAMKVLDENYGCFTGLMENKEGSVRFIIETAEIK